jgi:anti-sigma regulatory factor (Ser/Thr protein kinase)
MLNTTLQSETAMTETISIPINKETDVFNARIKGKKTAAAMGFGEIALAEIEIVISELGTNIVKHAGSRGIIIFRPVRDARARGIEIIARDRGTGMRNGTSIRDGISTTGTLGIGLSGVKRLMDELDVKTGESGSVIRTVKWMAEDFRSQIRCSALSKPKSGETVCGDAFFFKRLPSCVVFSVIDALGHGLNAHRVAEQTLGILENHYREPLETIIKCCHLELKNTRGAAISIGRIDFHTGKFQHIGIGNVETRVYGTPEVISPSCTNGTLGMNIERIRTDEYLYTKGMLLVMFSDGISQKFEIESAMLRKTPQEISNFVLDSYARAYDDATVLVLK